MCPRSERKSIVELEEKNPGVLKPGPFLHPPDISPLQSDQSPKPVMPTLPKPILELEGEVETTQTRQEPSFSGVFGAMIQLLWARSHLMPNLYRRWTEPLELWWFNSWLLVSAPDQLLFPAHASGRKKRTKLSHFIANWITPFWINFKIYRAKV